MSLKNVFQYNKQDITKYKEEKYIMYYITNLI
jgi:hypothetical protein